MGQAEKNSEIPIYTAGEDWNHAKTDKRTSRKIIVFHAFIYERPQKRWGRKIVVREE